MSPDLKTYIDALPIHTFVLTGDLFVIGRLVESHDGAVQVNALCSIETLYGENIIQQKMVPLVPLSIDQTTTIYRSHIVLQTPASFPLKKSYCDVLLRTKVQEAMQSNSSSLETTNQNPFSDLSNDRWNYN